MSRPTSNRREFLQGRAAADALAAAIDRVLPAPQADPSAAPAASESQDGDRYLVQYARQAMACQFAVLLNAGQYDEGAESAIAALDLVEQLEEQLTVYRDTSEVMLVNREAAAREVVLEPGVYALLSNAVRMARETGGAFDITAGPLVKTWGFYKRAGAIPSEHDLQTALARVGSQHIVLDDARHTIHFAKPGMELNLGAIGKGYALDRSAQLLADAGVADFLLHGGQSSVLARGSRGGAATGGWSVGLRDPLRPERRLAEIRLRDRALATSGATHQFFRHQGKRYGHILDPRTGWPAAGVFSSTALAPTAAEADALSTAFYTMGVEAARAFCADRAEIGMVLLYPDKQGSSVEVATAGLEAGDWRLLD
ncbi:MAG TPA: FAD:protein FMN transferase [Pirellulales bacterium]|jgi:thiamine biosynthesis lipoprotein